jgi:FdhD protein
MITSGRISHDILLKVAMRKIPVIISVSAPTDMAVELAASWGITLIGFARERRMNIYTESWRVAAE